MDTRYPHEIVPESEIPAADLKLFRKLTPHEFNELRGKSAEERAAWLRRERVREILAKPLAERTTVDRLILSQAGISNASQ